MHYVYIVLCADGTLYTGYTTDIHRRVQAHNAGKGAKYTAARTPVQLMYTETFETKSNALKREYEIKQWSRGQKQALIHAANERFIPNTIGNI